MKRFSKLMSLLLFAAVTQYSCINDADVVIADDTHSESNGNLALFFEIPTLPPVEVPNRPALPPKVRKKNMR